MQASGRDGQLTECNGWSGIASGWFGRKVCEGGDWARLVVGSQSQPRLFAVGTAWHTNAPTVGKGKLGHTAADHEIATPGIATPDLANHHQKFQNSEGGGCAVCTVERYLAALPVQSLRRATAFAFGGHIHSGFVCAGVLTSLIIPRK